MKYRVTASGLLKYSMFRTDDKSAAIEEAQKRANEEGIPWSVHVGRFDLHGEIRVTPEMKTEETTMKESMNTREEFEIKMEALGHFGCGLNSTWNCQAWCLNAGTEFDGFKGDVCLIDMEQDLEGGDTAYEVVLRIDDYDTLDNDSIESLIEFETAEKALAWILLLDSVKTWRFGGGARCGYCAHNPGAVDLPGSNHWLLCYACFDVVTSRKRSIYWVPEINEWYGKATRKGFSIP